MADLVITEANVALSTQRASTEVVQLGATMTPGQPYYKDGNDSDKAKPADADAVDTAAAAGILISGGVLDDWAIGVIGGYMKPGATLTQGVEYYVSTTAGGIAPQADLLTGDYITVLGRAIDASTLNVSPDATGITVP